MGRRSEMIFSHVNEGEMNLGETTSAAFTIFDEMGKDVTYLGRDFLKCCGRQKWQGMTEVFENSRRTTRRTLERRNRHTGYILC